MTKMMLYKVVSPALSQLTLKKLTSFSLIDSPFRINNEQIAGMNVQVKEN